MKGIFKTEIKFINSFILLSDTYSEHSKFVLLQIRDKYKIHL